MRGRGRWVIHHRGAELIHGFLELHMHRLQGAQAPQRARTGLAAMPFATKSAKRRRPLFPYEPLKVYEVMKRANVVNEEATSGLPRLADILKVSRHVSNVPILLQKSFCITDCKFSGPYVRRSNNHLRDYVILR